MNNGRKFSPEWTILVLLLLFTLRQGWQLHTMEKELQQLQLWSENQLEALSDQLYRNEDRLTQEIRSLNDPIARHSLLPAGVDAENKAILANLSLTLKETESDTAVTLRLDMSDGNSQSVELVHEEGATFVTSQPLSLPLDADSVRFSAAVKSGGVTRAQELDSTQLHLLLPLRQGGMGWSGQFRFSGKTLHIVDDLSVRLDDPENPPSTAADGRFRVFRNEQEVFSSGALVESINQYSPADWQTQFEAAPGDTFRIVFTCRDRYGLGYAFVLRETHIREDGVLSVPTSYDAPQLFW